jgi:hypothetical protein
MMEAYVSSGIEEIFGGREQKCKQRVISEQGRIVEAETK